MGLQEVASASIYLSGYFQRARDVLLHPTRAAPEDAASGRAQQRNFSGVLFVITCLTLGALISTLVPERKYSTGLSDDALVILVCWVTFTFWADLVSRLLAGKARSSAIAWCSFELFCALSVVSALVNVAGGIIVTNSSVSSYLVATGTFGDSIANNPIYIFFFTQLGLFNIYLPLRLKVIRNLTWPKVAITMLALSCFWPMLAIAMSPPSAHY